MAITSDSPLSLLPIKATTRPLEPSRLLPLHSPKQLATSKNKAEQIFEKDTKHLLATTNVSSLSSLRRSGELRPDTTGSLIRYKVY